MDIKELINKTQETPSFDWERELYFFVKEWISEDDAIEVKTSGSTGLPKVIKHKKEAMRQSAVMTCDFLGLKPGMKALLCLSTRSIAGMMMVVRAFERSLDIIPVAPVGHPLKDLNVNIEIDFCAMVPAQVFNSLKVPEERRILENIKNLIVGGAPVSYQLRQEISTFPGNVYATFGMTETMSHVALSKLNGPDASDEYRILPGIRIDIGRKMSTEEFPIKQLNEGIVKTGNLVIHVPYLENSPIITNDIVEMTGPQTFRWLGRLDHIINTGGFKIYPEDIEARIAPVMYGIEEENTEIEHNVSGRHSTQRYFIASVSDEKLGEVPVLLIEMDEPPAVKKEIQVSSVLAKLSVLLQKHEVPRAVYFIPKFIETPTGKIIRSATLKRVSSSL